MRSLRYLILGLVFTAVVAFGVANRHFVRFVFDPIAGPDSTAAVEAPFFIYIFVVLIIGFLLGGAVSWISQGRWRRLARQRQREMFELKKENERLARHLRIMERTPQLRVSGGQPDVRERPMIH
ncbi:MAG: LapA family protein [Alphaproteobacteria bacterium]